MFLIAANSNPMVISATALAFLPAAFVTLPAQQGLEQVHASFVCKKSSTHPPALPFE
jgi:hypothetical protein